MTELKAWIKYDPQHSTTANGAVTLRKPYRTPGERAGELKRLLRHISQRIQEGKIWQARIYEQPGNAEIFSWTNQEGFKRGENMIEAVRQEMAVEEVIEELQQFL